MDKDINSEFKSVFRDGNKPALEEVLNNKERRVGFIKKLLSLYPDYTIISYKLNIPGKVKNNEVIYQIFEIGLENISDCVENEKWESVYSKKLNLKTGPEYFEVISADVSQVKEKMTLIEENMTLGRIFDIDVIYLENNNLHYMERREIGYPNRKCFICNSDAKLCASRRTHSVSDIHKHMQKLIESDGRIKL